MTELTVVVMGRPETEQASSILASEKGMRVVAITSSRSSFEAALGQHAPAAAVVDVSAIGGDEVVEACRAAARRGLPTVAIGGAADAALLSRAVTAGARAFLIRPYEPEELLRSVREVTAEAADAGPARRDAGGAIVAAYGPKGGSGTTTIATALAVALTAQAGRRVGLVDLDLRFGDVGISLDLRSPNSISDLIAQPGNVDQALVDDLFVRHSSGVLALLAPETLALAESVEPVAVVRALEALRGHFDVLVCDLPSSFDDITAAVLQSCDLVLLITTPELAALKDVQRAVVAAPALRGDARAKLVVNRYPSRAAVDLPHIEQALGRKVACTIPSDGAAVTQALNTGISVLDPRSHIRAVKSYRDLAELVARQVAAAEAA